MSRPHHLVLVTGTATEIGKTWVGGKAIAELRGRGLVVAARKPAQSFDPDDHHPSDAEVLSAASGEPAHQVCPPHRAYPVAMAPPMAAEVLGLAVPTTADLLAELAWPDPPVDVGWLETVGGPRSPIAVDGDAVTIARALRPEVVVVVADAGLGTVNAVALTVDAFSGFRVEVILNRFDAASDLHHRNVAWLVKHHGLRCATTITQLADHILDG